MASQPNPSAYRPWVENIAGRIENPLNRLRFLQSAAPQLRVAMSGDRGHATRLSFWSRKLLIVLIGMAAVAALGIVGLVATSNRATALPAAHLPLPPVAETLPPDVWLVESDGVEET
jgi:hypothetical protein